VDRFLQLTSSPAAPKTEPEPVHETYREMLLRRAREDEAAGKAWIMRDPGVKPRLPRKPSWSLD
jgi:hypothetical protein